MLADQSNVLGWRRSQERGASMVEYALLVVLIAIIAVVAIQMAGDNVSSTFSNVGTELANPGN
jgi:pilus assembly protein Flp/PilA